MTGIEVHDTHGRVLPAPVAETARLSAYHAAQTCNADWRTQNAYFRALAAQLTIKDTP